MDGCWLFKQMQIKQRIENNYCKIMVIDQGFFELCWIL